jgi:hypothetical protein
VNLRWVLVRLFPLLSAGRDKCVGGKLREKGKKESQVFTPVADNPRHEFGLGFSVVRIPAFLGIFPVRAAHSRSRNARLCCMIPELVK